MILAYDLGGTNLRCALLEEDGTILARARQATGTRPKPEETVDQMGSLADQVTEQAKVHRSQVTCIGIGCPGPLDSRIGVIHRTPHLGWNNVPLAKLVEQSQRIPTFLENDATSACVGEHWRGAGQGMNSLFILTLGTGVGGGILLNDELYRGIDDTAGHLGHMVIDPGGPSLVFDNPGSLEALCSATALIRDAKQAALEHPQSALAQLSSITGESVAVCANEGDQTALRLFEQLGERLGIACATLANALNPEGAIIGGGLSSAWPLFEPAMTREFQRRALPAPGQRMVLRRAQLGDDAGILGCARLAWKRQRANG